MDWYYGLLITETLPVPYLLTDWTVRHSMNWRRILLTSLSLWTSTALLINFATPRVAFTTTTASNALTTRKHFVFYLCTPERCMPRCVHLYCVNDGRLRWSATRVLQTRSRRSNTEIKKRNNGFVAQDSKKYLFATMAVCKEIGMQ